MSCYHVVALNEFKLLLTIYEWTHGNPKQSNYFSIQLYGAMWQSTCSQIMTFGT